MTRRDWAIAQLAELKALRTVDAQWTLKRLLALAEENDPWTCGRPARQQRAAWFGEIFAQYWQKGMHLRRLHYALVSQRTPPQLPDGSPYVNTDRVWKFLLSASKDARYLDFVPASAFTERRTALPTIHAWHRVPPVPSCGLQPLGPRLPNQLPRLPHQAVYVSLPSIKKADLSLWPTVPSLNAPKFSIDEKTFVNGYDAMACDAQPYTLEWVEKSTMNDVFDPLCDELNINFVPGVGFASITQAVEMLIERAQKQPVRLFYISDHDPAGEGMPVAVARQIEWWRTLYAPQSDIKLLWLALTEDQIKQYDLPRSPIKNEDKRKDAFELRRGEGACELDALEAVVPGELARIVRTAVAPYVDRTFNDRLRAADTAARAQVHDAWKDTIAEDRAQLDQLHTRIAAIVEQHAANLDAATADDRTSLEEIQNELDDMQARLDRVVEEHQAALDTDLAPLKATLDAIRQAVEQKAADFHPELPPRPEPTLDVDERRWLYDSRRDYLDQWVYYTAHRPDYEDWDDDD